MTFALLLKIGPFIYRDIIKFALYYAVLWIRMDPDPAKYEKQINKNVVSL